MVWRLRNLAGKAVGILRRNPRMTDDWMLGIDGLLLPAVQVRPLTVPQIFAGYSGM